jgi:hypothetical protein
MDAIDTTVTLEWAQTRTVATLVNLGERVATVTALRTPDVGLECFLRLEGDGPADTIALDGVCIEARDGDWGEFEVDIQIARVGTTTSATALRDFIEQHRIARGGTVAVGKNRDNPDIKRFVYTLPALGGSFDTPSSRGSQPRLLPKTELGSQLSGAALDTPRVSAPEPITSPVSGFAPRLPSVPNAIVQPLRPPTPTSMPGVEVDEVDAELRNMLDMLDQRVARAPSEEGNADSAAKAVRVDPGMMPEDRTHADHPSSSGSEEDEQILVETVEFGDAQPRPVMTVPQARPSAKKGLVARIFGFGDKERAEESAPITRSQPESAPADPLAVWDQPVRKPQSGRGLVSGSLAAVQQLYSVDQAVRTERPVTFESGKKKRTGTVLRLAESKIRVRAPVLPTIYERIVVQLPAPRGTKDTISVRCEVMRLRPADHEGEEPSFDAKLTGANDPTTMTRLRQLMSEMQPEFGDA